MAKTMQNRMTLAAILGLFAVGLGAFGAHALRARLEAAEATATWQTAVLYHLVHSLAILAIARTGETGRVEKWRSRAAWSWGVGVVLFSGSLYALALGGLPKAVAYFTPIGGLAFLFGWACLIPASARPTAGKPGGGASE